MTITNKPHQLPLHGLQVIELQAIGPVPFAGMLLAQLGARVCRIAAPQDPGLGISIPAQFDALNSGKLSQTIDLKSASGLEQLYALLAQTDVLLEGFRPGVLERLGLAPQAMLQRAPQLVIGRLSGWGDQGALAARAGHDINYLALSGALHAIGEQHQPVPPLNLVADFGGGAMHLVVGVLAKLLQRSLDPNKQGGLVTTSILAGTHGLLPMFHGMVQAGLHSTQRGTNLLDGGMPFYRCYKTADNAHVAIGALEPKFYFNLLRMLNLLVVLDPEKQYRADTWVSSTQVIAQTIATQTRAFWAEQAEQIDCCLSPVLTFEEASRHPHNLDNLWFGDSPVTPDWPTKVIRFD
jgi:alpha-methylacyl-CoA racemase